MSYHSIIFWAVFLPIFLIAYFLMPGVKTRQFVIFLGNVVFYCSNGVYGLFILTATTMVVYVSSRAIERVYAHYDEEKTDMTPKEQAALFSKYKKHSRKTLWYALFCIVGVLAYVKAGRYLGWEEIESFRHFRLKTVLIPLGLSYYTFSSIGYLLDVYWRKTKCEHNIFKLFLCMTFFPHIVQGPISKYQKVMKQFDGLPGFQYENVCFGLQLFLWGIFKKIVIADRLALYTGTVAASLSDFANPSAFAGVEVFLAIILGTIQLYADFSGCMDMVCGISQCLGISLEQNFNHPFLSKSAAEFWRRWHITLGTWFKDYIYMPIATSPRFLKLAAKIRKKYGKRAGQNFSTAVPLIVVWFLTGMWHGTGNDYLAWGLYWGVLLILSNLVAPELKKINESLHIRTESFGFRLFQMFRTFALFCIGRTFTMAGSLAGCWNLWRSFFAEHRLWALFDGSLYTHGLDQKNFYIALVGIMLMLGVDILQERTRIRETLARQPLVFRWAVYHASILVILIFGMYGNGYDASSFIYRGF